MRHYLVRVAVLAVLLAACNRPKVITETETPFLSSYSLASEAQAARVRLIAQGATVTGLRFSDGAWGFHSSLKADTLRLSTRPGIPDAVMACTAIADDTGTSRQTACDLASEAQAQRQALIDCNCGYQVEPILFDPVSGRWWFSWEWEGAPRLEP